MNIKDQIDLQTKLLNLKSNSKEFSPREITFLITLVNNSHVNKMFTDDIY